MENKKILLSPDLTVVLFGNSKNFAKINNLMLYVKKEMIKVCDFNMRLYLKEHP